MTTKDSVIISIVSSSMGIFFYLNLVPQTDKHISLFASIFVTMFIVYLLEEIGQM